MIPTYIDTTVGLVWHQIPSKEQAGYMDRFQAFIIHHEKGQRYAKTVEVTGRERENGEGALKLINTLQDVCLKGAQICHPLEEGGFFPQPD